MANFIASNGSTDPGVDLVTTHKIGIGATSPNTNLHVGSVQNDDSIGRLGFKTAGTDDRMVIDTNGNVGIGTASPASTVKLDVIGNVAATKVCIGGASGPQISTGSTAPSGSGVLGSLYIRTASGNVSLYIYTGNNTWTIL